RLHFPLLPLGTSHGTPRRGGQRSHDSTHLRLDARRASHSTYIAAWAPASTRPTPTKPPPLNADLIQSVNAPKVCADQGYALLTTSFQGQRGRLAQLEYEAAQASSSTAAPRPPPQNAHHQTQPSTRLPSATSPDPRSPRICGSRLGCALPIRH
ncbi:MAG: hypothetical protein SGPRY_014864, partial [Prymnesium sp.]